MTGPLKNARHERFAQELAKGLSQLAAYEAAGYRPDDGAAARLSGNVRVKERLAELQAEIAAEVVKEAVIDATWVLNKAVKLLKECEKDGDRVNARGFMKLIGDHIAVQAFKKQVEHSGLVEYKNLSDEEVAARIAAHEAEHGKRPTAH